MKITSIAFEPIENNKRIQPKGIEAKKTSTNKTGIKVYHKAIGCILAIFGVAVRIKDADNKIWYVNKNSLRGWGKSNSGDEKFKLKNLDTLLQNIKSRPSSTPPELKKESVPKPSLAYPAGRIAKELWLNDNIPFSEGTVQRVNLAADYLQKLGFDLVGAVADGNCLFDAYEKGHELLTRKIPILNFQEDKIQYLRDLLSNSYEKNPDRADEIKKNGVHVTANEAERLVNVLDKPIRFITPIEGGDISDLLARKGKETQDWDTLEEKPKMGDYIVIVDLGGHFITARPLKIS